MYVQVKRYNKSVGKELADKFIGAVSTFINKNHTTFSHVEGLYITTGTYPTSFRKQLSDAQKTGLSFKCWDGVEFAENMLKLGMGVKYSVDSEFWERVNPGLILGQNASN